MTPSDDEIRAACGTLLTEYDRDDHKDDAARLHREKCDCILREMALTAERDALQSQCNNQRQIIDDSLKPHATLIAERGAALARAERAERLLAYLDPHWATRNTLESKK